MTVLRVFENEKLKYLQHPLCVQCLFRNKEIRMEVHDSGWRCPKCCTFLINWRLLK